MKGANTAYNESTKRTTEINIIMKSLGLNEIPNELKNISIGFTKISRASNSSKINLI